MLGAMQLGMLALVLTDALSALYRWGVAFVRLAYHAE